MPLWCMALYFLMGYFVGLFARGDFIEFFNFYLKSHHFVVGCSINMPAVHHVVKHILISSLGESFIMS